MARGRWNGGIIGPNLKVTTSSASGIFSLSEAQVDVSAGLLPQAPPPVIILPDSQFNLTTLLLHGDGSNGAQNNTFLDGSTNALAITRNGTPTQGTFSPFSQTGWSNLFSSATSDYLSLPTAVGNLGTGDFTIECWWRAASTTQASQAAIIAKYPSATQNAWGFKITSASNANTLQFSYYDSGYQNAVSSFNANDLSWHHIAVTRQGTALKLYADGNQVLSTTLSSAGINFGNGISAVTTIGQEVIDGTYINGYVSNLRILTGTALYTGSTYTVPTSPLTAITNTSLLTCQSNRFLDTGTNAYAITPSGSPSVQPFSPFPPAAAYGVSSVGGSAYFNGSTDYLTGTYSTTNHDWYTSDYTLECWVYPLSLSSFGYLDSSIPKTNLIGNNAYNLTSNYWTFGPYSDGTVGLTYYNGASVGVFSAATVKANQWNHIAFTKTSSGITIFVNGVASSTTPVSGTPQSGSGLPLTIGAGNNKYINGYVSNLRIVKGTAVYTGTLTPPTAPVTAITNTQLLLNGTNAGIYDSTAKNVITTAGSAQISTSQSQYGGSSIAFNGSTDYLLLLHNQNLVFGSGNFTMECWIYVTSAALNGLYAKRATNGTFAGVVWYVSGTNVLTLYMTNTGSSWQISGATGATTITQNAWHHVALVRNGSTINMFVDGAVDYTGSFTGSVFDGGAAVTLGAADAAAATWPFHGYIDDMRITTGYARYTSAFTPPTASFANQ
jgi:hypothetical protein